VQKRGYEQIAGYFLETAQQEQTHAKRFFRFLEGGIVEITASYPGGKIDQQKKIYWLLQKASTKNGMTFYPSFARIAEEERIQSCSAALKLLLLLKNS